MTKAKPLLFAIVLLASCISIAAAQTPDEESPFQEVEKSSETVDKNQEPRDDALNHPASDDSPFVVDDDKRKNDVANVRKFEVKDSINSLALAPNGGSVAFTTGRMNSALYIMECASGKIRLLKNSVHGGFPNTFLQFSPDGTHLLCGCFNGDIRVLTLSDNRQRVAAEKMIKIRTQVKRASFASKQPLVALFSGLGRISVFDFVNAEKVSEVVPSDFRLGSILASHLTANGGQALLADRKQILLFDLNEQKVSQRIGHSKSVSISDFSSDGIRLLKSGFGSGLSVVNVQTGKVVEKDVKGLKAAVFYGNDSVVALGNQEIEIRASESLNLIKSISISDETVAEMEDLWVSRSSNYALLGDSSRLASVFFLVRLENAADAQGTDNEAVDHSGVPGKPDKQ